MNTLNRIAWAGSLISVGFCIGVIAQAVRLENSELNIVFVRNGVPEFKVDDISSEGLNLRIAMSPGKFEPVRFPQHHWSR